MGPKVHKTATNNVESKKIETKKAVTPKKDNKPVPVGENKQAAPVKNEGNNYTESKINYVESQILEKRLKLSETSNSEKKAVIAKEIKALEEKEKKQKATATLVGNKEGNIEFTIKKPITVKEFKKLFNVEDGALRGQVSSSYQEYPEGTPEHDEGRQYIKHNEDETFEKGKKIKLHPASIDNQGFFTELWNSFTK